MSPGMLQRDISCRFIIIIFLIPQVVKIPGVKNYKSYYYY